MVEVEASSETVMFDFTDEHCKVFSETSGRGREASSESAMFDFKVKHEGIFGSMWLR